MKPHLFIKGDNDLCWSCGQSRCQHTTVVHREPAVRRPSRIDGVQGGQLPWFEVRP
jgi:hypothetical protein